MAKRDSKEWPTPFGDVITRNYDLAALLSPPPAPHSFRAGHLRPRVTLPPLLLLPIDSREFP